MNKKQFVVCFVVAFVAMMFLYVAFEDSWLNTGPERLLNIPMNVHHDLVGLCLLIVGCFDGKRRWVWFGLGSGLFVQHVLTEGILLVTPLAVL